MKSDIRKFSCFVLMLSAFLLTDVYVGAIAADDPKFIKQCGSWGIEYSKKHREMLAGDQKDQKFLVAVPHTSGKVFQSIDELALHYIAQSLPEQA